MKKITALILALSLFGSIGSAFSSAALSTFGVKISEDGEELALRKDFISNIINFIGLSPLNDAKQIFNDVPPGHPNFGSIMTAYESGFIYGNHNLQFMPDTPITYEQAYTILIRVLGYDVYLKQGMDVVSVASRIGLSKGIEYKGDKWVNHGDMAKLFSNFVDIPTIDIKFDGVNYTYNENGDTLLEKYRDATVLQGLVQGVGEKIIEANAKSLNDSIVINGQIYDTNGQDFTEYLGMYVEYVYTEIDGVDMVLSISPIQKCTAIDVNLRDVENYVNRAIIYTDENGKDKKATLDSNVIVSYNGSPVSSFGAQLFSGDNGSVRLINNNSDSTIDVVLIEEYEDIFIGNIDVVNGIVYDKFKKTQGGSAVSVNLSNLDEEHLVNSRGKAVELKSLQRNTLLSVLKTDTGAVVKAIVCSKVDEGIITSMSSEGNTVFAGGKEYYVTDACVAVNNFKVGDNVEFYINVCSNAAAVITAGAGNVRYGYLMKLFYDSDIETTYAKILTTDNIKIRAKINTKFNLNGVRSSHSYSTIRSAFSDTNGFLPQLVRYTTDSEGNITMLDSVGSANEGGSPSLVSLYAKTSSMRYSSSGSSFGAKLIVDNALVFQVPDEDDPAKRGTYEDKKYIVSSTGNLINNRTYTVAAYSTEPTEFLADAFVVYDTTSSGVGMYDGEVFAVIKSIGQTLDADGEVVPRLEYIYKGEVYSYPVVSKSVVEDALEKPRETTPTLELKVGDAVRIALNEEGDKISYLQYVYSLTDGRDDTITNFSGYHEGILIPNNSLDKYDYFVLTTGHVYKIINNNIYFAKKSIINTGAELGLDNLVAFKAETVPVVIYDPNDEDILRVANLNELKESSDGVEGDFVLLKTYLGALQIIYVVRQ